MPTPIESDRTTEADYRGLTVKELRALCVHKDHTIATLNLALDSQRQYDDERKGQA